MMRNLSASSLNAQEHKTTLMAYLHTFKDNPSKIAKLLTIFVLPGAALGWWYYSLAMSVGAMTPLHSVSETSDDVKIVPTSNSSTTSEDIPTSPSQSSSVSSDKIDLKINNSMSDNSQTGTVEVNGQSVPIPDDGSTHQVIQNDNSKTTVDINVDSGSSGASTSRSSTNINIRSSSKTDVNVESEETN